MPTAERWVVVFEKTDDPDYPVLPLTGTRREILADLAAFLDRHPELNSSNFLPYREQRIS